MAAVNQELALGMHRALFSPMCTAESAATSKVETARSAIETETVHATDLIRVVKGRQSMQSLFAIGGFFLMGHITLERISASIRHAGAEVLDVGHQSSHKILHAQGHLRGAEGAWPRLCITTYHQRWRSDVLCCYQTQLMWRQLCFDSFMGRSLRPTCPTRPLNPGTRLCAPPRFEQPALEQVNQSLRDLVNEVLVADINQTQELPNPEGNYSDPQPLGQNSPDEAAATLFRSLSF